MTERKEFKAESKRLLDLMINSIYTHKEIFLRELISNASDALDKYYLESLKHSKVPEPLKIRIDLNEVDRTLTISDNGIGMSKEELEENLGTIAKSGSLAFKEELKALKKESGEQEGEESAKAAASDEKASDIIGQFGVGFYSAFMVAKSILVVSKAYGSDQAYSWQSDGTDGYTIEEAERADHGTTIILQLKDSDDEEQYDKYLDSYTISNLIRKYSDYIRYPIEMDFKTQKMVEETKDSDTPEFEEVTETRTVNSMVPIWKKPKADVSDEELSQFYMDHFHSYSKPLDTLFFNVEGTTSFTALLYIPSKAPANFNTVMYKPGLELYSRGVLIEEHTESLLPDYLRFLQGIVDSPDLSLNISREMLQHDRQLSFIRRQIERRTLKALASMQEKEPENYETFWNSFGWVIKSGLLNHQTSHIDELRGLLIFPTSVSEKMITLKEFVEKMPEDDKEIYYLTGSDPASLRKLPAAAKLESKGYPILFLSETFDEMILESIGTYEGHEFRNAAQGELDLDSEDEKKALAEQNEASKDILDYMKEALPEVSEVRLSNRLLDDPVVLVAGPGISFDMERTFQMMAKQSGESMPAGMGASRILEINPNSPIWALIRSEYAINKENVKSLAEVLYDQACLIEGFPVKDPVGYARKVAALLTDSMMPAPSKTEEDKNKTEE